MQWLGCGSCLIVEPWSVVEGAACVQRLGPVHIPIETDQHCMLGRCWYKDS